MESAAAAGDNQGQGGPFDRVAKDGRHTFGFLSSWSDWFYPNHYHSQTTADPFRETSGNPGLLYKSGVCCLDQTVGKRILARSVHAAFYFFRHRAATRDGGGGGGKNNPNTSAHLPGCGLLGIGGLTPAFMRYAS
jgi:hypothetical protein